MIVAVSGSRVIGLLIVAVLVALFVAVIIGTHRPVIVRTILGSG
jgi:hypothetical protein